MRKLLRQNSKSLDQIFKVKVYDPSRGKYYFYRFKLDTKGWFISFMKIEGSCSPEGKPFLYKNFNQDSIGYHLEFPDLLADLWYKAHLENMTPTQVDFNLNKLFLWLNRTNMTSPHFALRKKTKDIIKRHYQKIN
jgi:hypothetical protein